MRDTQHQISLFEEKKNIYSRCIDVYGLDAQIIQSMGECGEFIGAAQNYRRDKVPLDILMGEVVDVYVMMLQMRETNPEMFDGILKQTLKRIEDIVERKERQIKQSGM